MDEMTNKIQFAGFWESFYYYIEDNVDPNIKLAWDEINTKLNENKASGFSFHKQKDIDIKQTWKEKTNTLKFGNRTQIGGCDIATLEDGLGIVWYDHYFETIGEYAYQYLETIEDSLDHQQGYLLYDSRKESDDPFRYLLIHDKKEVTSKFAESFSLQFANDRKRLIRFGQPVNDQWAPRLVNRKQNSLQKCNLILSLNGHEYWDSLKIK